MLTITNEIGVKQDTVIMPAMINKIMCITLNVYLINHN